MLRGAPFVDLNWLAGFLDGRGSLLIEGGIPRLAINSSKVQDGCLEAFKKVANMSHKDVVTSPPSGMGKRLKQTLNIHGPACTALLEAVLPYMRSARRDRWRSLLKEVEHGHSN